jgi:hypothetical protein
MTPDDHLVTAKKELGGDGDGGGDAVRAAYTSSQCY